MAFDLVPYERALEPLLPVYTDLLRGIMDPRRLIRTVLISVEKTPELAKCTMPSIVNAATSLAVLGLEADGMTGQGYLIPFKNKGVPMAQPVVGYKGYNTLAWRAGYTINGGIVREGDDLEFSLGTDSFVRHRPILGAPNRPILGVWAVAVSKGKPPMVQVMSLQEILAVKAKSPGAKRYDSPWNDETIGFPAMAEKTVKRRLARSMPMNTMQLAAIMEQGFEEMGRVSYLRPDGALMQGEIATPSAPTEADILPRYVVILANNEEKELPDLPTWQRQWQAILSKYADRPTHIEHYRAKNEAAIEGLRRHHPQEVDDLLAAIEQTQAKPESSAPRPQEPVDAPPIAPTPEPPAEQAPHPEAPASPASPRPNPLDSAVEIASADDERWRFWLPSQSEEFLEAVEAEFEKHVSARDEAALTRFRQRNQDVFQRIRRSDSRLFNQLARLRDAAQIKMEAAK